MPIWTPNRIFNAKFGSSEDAMRQAARDIMISVRPDLYSMRTALHTVGMAAPDYSEEEGIAIADAFTDKIMELVSH
ncbi:hypothetical protein [Bacillus sp. T33-2]|uniref:hypothetical protein n=1 Tax=Bacillus sp. T33-2 TaxID=2054168 RepID=UPI000C780351|nr:hypothetical protein [Bacillus sp. T33-2]PLR96944.1 hypothetical protein CVD19_10185 [Bacillus sp. T33-2]